MKTWYIDATWSAVRALFSPAMLSRYSVKARCLECLPGEPFLLLSNHSNELDPWVLGSLVDRPVRYMANLSGVAPLKAAMAFLVGAYGKVKGRRDRSALRETLALAAAGESIGIFPEGDRSWDGKTSGIDPSIAKLAIRLDLPILLARQKGAYLSRPRWAASSRRGAWEVDFSVLRPKAIANVAGGLDLHGRIVEILAHDDIEACNRDLIEFSCANPANGLHRLLWLCPACEGHDTITARGISIRCCECKSIWTIDANLRFRGSALASRRQSPPMCTVGDWTSWQSARAKTLLLEGGMVTVTDGVELLCRSGKEHGPSWVSAGTGSLALRGASLDFFIEGTKSFSLNLGEIGGFVDNFNRFSSIFAGREEYRLLFNGANAYKWQQFISAARTDGTSGSKVAV